MAFPALSSSINLTHHFGLANHCSLKTQKRKSHFSATKVCALANFIHELWENIGIRITITAQGRRRRLSTNRQQKENIVGDSYSSPMETNIKPDTNEDRSSKKEQSTEAARRDYSPSTPPLVNALKALAERNAARFHFPGHNGGRGAPSSFTKLIGIKPFMHDLTQIPDLDDFFRPKGPVLEAMQEAAKLFGASETWFLVGGSTCGNMAAIMATCSPGEHIILPRNSHLSVTSALVLSGAIPRYIIPEYDSNWDIAGGVTRTQIDRAIKDLKMEGQKVSAVFVTSPTYYGVCSNLSEISQICHSHGIPLIVDEAHGAHFGFQPQLPRSALQQGADLVVQSTHKVLSSLTQSSMLHMSGNIVDRERVCRCLQTLQSTSPSYLLLASLDAARAQLSDNPDKFFNKPIALANKAKNNIKKIPGISILEFPIFSNFPAIDPLKLTVGFQKLGLSGYEADKMLYKNHDIVCELFGTQSITYVINLGTREDDIQRLVSGIEDVSSSAFILGIEGRSKASVCSTLLLDTKISLSPRDAFFARKRRENIKECVGKVCGELLCPYPPATPVIIPGEVISEEALEYLLYLKSKGAYINGASDPQLSSLLVCNV